MPTSVSAGGSGAGSSLTTKPAKHRPAASWITVTDDGADGSGRDQRTRTSPIFARFSLPSARSRNPFLVNLTD